MKPTIHIAGCGAVGRAVAMLFLEQGILPTASVNTETSQTLCKQMGLDCEIMNLDGPAATPVITPPGKILYTVPPPRSGMQDTRIARLLSTLNPLDIQQFVLISTTGVYGDCKGAWVDEHAPVQPKADRAHRRADAEARLQAWAAEFDIPSLILRVPGIYHPQRLPLKRLRNSTPLVKQQTPSWTNRIHADDLARACYLALNSDLSNEIINISDDSPGTMIEYFNAIADYAGLPRPPLISPEQAQQDLSSGMLSYLAESRRIDNRKMKRLLKMALAYPGLADALKPNIERQQNSDS